MVGPSICDNAVRHRSTARAGQAVPFVRMHALLGGETAASVTVLSVGFRASHIYYCPQEACL